MLHHRHVSSVSPVSNDQFPLISRYKRVCTWTTGDWSNAIEPRWTRISEVLIAVTLCVYKLPINSFGRLIERARDKAISVDVISRRIFLITIFNDFDHSVIMKGKIIFNQREMYSEQHFLILRICLRYDKSDLKWSLRLRSILLEILESVIFIIVTNQSGN